MFKAQRQIKLLQHLVLLWPTPHTNQICVLNRLCRRSSYTLLLVPTLPLWWRCRPVYISAISIPALRTQLIEFLWTLNETLPTAPGTEILMRFYRLLLNQSWSHERNTRHYSIARDEEHTTQSGEYMGPGRIRCWYARKKYFRIKYWMEKSHNATSKKVSQITRWAKWEWKYFRDWFIHTSCINNGLYDFSSQNPEHSGPWLVSSFASFSGSSGGVKVSRAFGDFSFEGFAYGNFFLPLIMELFMSQPESGFNLGTLPCITTQVEVLLQWIDNMY